MSPPFLDDMTTRRRIYLAAALLSCLLALGSCMMRDGSVSRLFSAAGKAATAATLDDEDVAEYAREYMEYLDGTNDVLPEDSPYSERLAALTADLKRVDGIVLNFKVYRDDDLNAFACADGSVRVLTGLMDAMTDGELLGVIGHELGHLAHKDSKESFKKALIASAVRDGIGATGGLLSQMSDSALADLSEALVAAKHSRSQELAADGFAYGFLKSNGWNPWEMVKAFEKIRDMSDDEREASSLERLYASHPDISERIERIEQCCIRDGYKRPGES